MTSPAHAHLRGLEARCAFPSIAHASLATSSRVAITRPLMSRRLDALDALGHSDDAMLYPDRPTWRTSGTLATLRAAFTGPRQRPLAGLLVDAGAEKRIREFLARRLHYFLRRHAPPEEVGLLLYSAGFPTLGPQSREWCMGSVSLGLQCSRGRLHVALPFGLFLARTLSQASAALHSALVRRRSLVGRAHALAATRRLDADALSFGACALVSSSAANLGRELELLALLADARLTFGVPQLFDCPC